MRRNGLLDTEKTVQLKRLKRRTATKDRLRHRLIGFSTLCYKWAKTADSLSGRKGGP